MLTKLFDLLVIRKKLLLKKGATLVTTSAAGVEASVTAEDLAAVADLSGLTATVAELNAVCDDNTATAAEITRTCDISARVVTTTATALSLTITQHADRVVLVNTNSTVANTITLPVATGSGAKYTIINNIAQTQGTLVVAASGTLDTLTGVALIGDTTAETAGAFLTSATSDKLSMNLTTTGGLGGDQVELLDGAANVWTVRATLTGSGTLATPFSAS